MLNIAQISEVTMKLRQGYNDTIYTSLVETTPARAIPLEILGDPMFIRFGGHLDWLFQHKENPC